MVGRNLERANENDGFKMIALELDLLKHNKVNLKKGNTAIGMYLAKHKNSPLVSHNINISKTTTTFSRK